MCPREKKISSAAKMKKIEILKTFFFLARAPRVPVGQNPLLTEKNEIKIRTKKNKKQDRANRLKEGNKG